MEYRTELSLEENVGNWINHLSITNEFNKPDLEELESHLYDEIDHLAETGLSPEESFIIATKRLGKQEIITGEYQKINNSFYAKITPYLKGILIYFSVFGVLGFLKTSLFFIIQPTLEEVDPFTISNVTLGFLFLLIIGLLLVAIKSKTIAWHKLINKLTLPLLFVVSVLTEILNLFLYPWITKFSILNYDQISAIHINFTIFKGITIFLFGVFMFYFYLKNKKANKFKYA